MSVIRAISTANAPRPGGHYMQAIASEELIFVSGQLPMSSDGHLANDAPFAHQAHLAIANMLAIVQAADSDASHILKVTAYIVGIRHWSEFNRIYAELLDSARPARSIVPVPELHFGCLVEVDAIALKRRLSG